MNQNSLPSVDVLMVGTGEYTTGFVHQAASGSDKGAGVVALTLFDLRQQGKVGKCLMAGTQGTKFPAIRDHLQQVIGNRYAGITTDLETYPTDNVPRDPTAYCTALEQLSPGATVIVFTPDDLHFAIALEAIQRGCHVLIAKPLVKTVAEHRQLVQAAEEKNVLVAMEVHKRWDPIYRDARDQIRRLGAFNHFASYMSQPRTQLETFRHWAGKSSDISYYLNAHHIDFNLWAVGHLARPTQVSSMASSGVAHALGIDTEDTITLTTTWEALSGNDTAVATYTASWVAPKSDVHSQQRFFYLGSEGEITVDQAHRGYTIAEDRFGLRSANPLFMKYEPDAEGRFDGRHAYGYRSIADFINAAQSINAGITTPEDWRGQLATAQETMGVTAILEAGRRSLDMGNQPIRISYDSRGNLDGLEV